ncbi:MAG: hypothetical protein B5M51_05925 [Anaerolinea sp. 4484_236]|nr:MAG: hypothetical protein B5M51_05925 [Anaerolinea sp. 4484_236]
MHLSREQYAHFIKIIEMLEHINATTSEAAVFLDKYAHPNLEAAKVSPISVGHIRDLLHECLELIVYFR